MLWNLILWLLGFKRSRKIHGNAEFLHGFSRTKFLNKRNKGLVIDGVNRISLEKSFTHLAMIAPTGAGKTSRYVMPNILNIKDASFVVTDPSGEIRRTSEGYLRKKGYEVRVLNFGDVADSDRFNPLSRCTTSSDSRKMAEMLVDTAFSDSQGSDSFWNDSAKSIINLIIRALQKQPDGQRTLSNLYRYLNLFGHGQDEVNQLMADNLDQTSFEEYKAFLSQDDKVLNSILSTAKTSLSIFSDPNISEITSDDTVNFEQLRQSKTAVFVIVPEHEVRYYRFMLTVFYTQVFNYCMELPKKGEPYKAIFFFCDEFGNSGKWPGFSTLVTTLRKRRVSVSIVLQDIEQLSHTYGQSEASTILNGGCASRIFYPGISYKTCEELSRMLGTQTVKYQEEGFSKGEVMSSNRDREMGIPLMRPEEIMTMKSNQAIFTHSNLKPVLLKTKPWFKNRKLRRRAKI